MLVGRIRKHKKKTPKTKSNNDHVLPTALLRNAINLFVSDLSPEHALERCVINQEWQQSGMASIMIVRRAGGSLTAAGFLVNYPTAEAGAL